MKNMELKKIVITNLNQMATSHNISTTTINGNSSINCLTEKRDFKLGLPSGFNLNP